MSDYLVSIIRTWVPIIVGVVIAWLAEWGVDIADSDGAVAAVTGGAIGLYYAVVRAMEQRWPAVGVLLGRKAAPEYTR